MRKKISFNTLIILFLSFSVALSANAAWPILNENDMEQFIQTFPGMYEEYVQLGLKVNPETGKIEGSEKLKRDQEVKRILKANGWNFMFWPKLQTIVRGYSLIKQAEFTTHHGANIEKFVNDLTSAQWMTPEKKAELEAFYSKLKRDTASAADLKRQQVNSKDLKLIQNSIGALDTVMAKIAKSVWDKALAGKGNGTAQSAAPASNLLPVAGSVTGTPQQDFSHSTQADALTQIVGSVTSPRSQIKKVTVIREDGGRVSWSPRGDQLLIDQLDKDGYYDLYLIDPDGGNEQCLTCDTGNALSNGHHGTAEWHPSGEAIVFQSQKKSAVGNWGKDIAAKPGFGRHMDLWLMDLKTRRFHQLTHTQDTDDTGVLHPHFSHDGTKLTWSEMYEKPSAFKPAGQAGYWKLKVADFAWVDGTPQLSNVQTYQPGGPGLYENHGLTPDQGKILFTATFESKKSLDFFTTANIYLYDIAANKVQKLSTEKYNEHAHYYPDKKRILWMTSMQNPTRGTDYWSMNPDGSQKMRLTDFNNQDLPTYKGKMVISADSSFNPDGTKLVAYLQLNLLTQNGPIVVIDLSENEVTDVAQAPTHQVEEPNNPQPEALPLDIPEPPSKPSAVTKPQEEPLVSGGSTPLPPGATSGTANGHCWKHVSFSASYTGKHSSGHGTGKVFHQVQPGMYKEKWEFDIQNPGKNSKGSIYQEHPGEIVIPGDEICLGTEKMIKLDTLPSSRQYVCGIEPELGGKFCVEGRGNEKHAFYLFEEEDIENLSSFSPGNIPTHTQNIAGIQAVCFQTQEDGNRFTTCMHPEYAIIMRLHFNFSDGETMDLTATSFQVAEQPDNVFTPDGPMIDPFEKSEELGMIKQVLEETQAGQAGAGYDKLVDKIVEQIQGASRDKQQAEMLKQMLKEKLKNSSIEDILKEAGVEAP